MQSGKWPALVYLVRHGESAGNVARDQAEAAGLCEVRMDCARDMDVPLSSLGERQATALGRWLGAQEEGARPTTILTSPYLRARATVDRIALAARLDPRDVPVIVDERLREKEFGLFDGLTKMGVEQKYPEQAAARRVLGKFYHRPPGGESWCDVILRLRSVVDTMTREHRGERLLLVAHHVIVFCLRYLFEGMTEEQILAADRAHEIANCGVTEYRFDASLGRHGALALVRFNFVTPLEDAGERITVVPDAPVAPKG